MTEEKKMVVQGITFEPVLTTKQVCEIFKINKSTLVRWRKQGKFPQPIAINSRLKRYRKADIEALIANAR